MSFQNKDLSVIAYANGFTLWHYKTQDKMSEIDMDYFPKDIVRLMAVGDMIIINSCDGSCIKAIKSIQDGKVELCELSK